MCFRSYTCVIARPTSAALDGGKMKKDSVIIAIKSTQNISIQ